MEVMRNSEMDGGQQARRRLQLKPQERPHKRRAERALAKVARNGSGHVLLLCWGSVLLPGKSIPLT